MNKSFKTLFTLFLGILFIIPSFTASSAKETIEEIVESLVEIQEEFSKLSPSENKEADIIDQAIKEINKSTEFAIQSIEKKDTVTATSALSYIDKSISDVGKIIPKEYESDMSNADIASFAPDKLITLKSITDEMSKKKVVVTNELLDEIIELNSKGFNTTKISSALNDLGIDTITLIELDQRKFDKIKDEIVDNQLEISSKEESLNNLKYQRDIFQADSKIENLNKEKLDLTNKYNAELAKQTEDIDISNEDLNKSQKLAKQYNNEIEKISLQISQSQSQTKDLNVKINNLNTELDSSYKNIDSLTKEVTDFNNQLQKNSTLVLSQQTELNNLKSSLPTLDKKMNDLNAEKQTLTLKYEQELAKQADIAISDEDLNKSQKLTEQFNKEIENLSKQISTIDSQDSSLTSKIDALAKEINTKTLASNDLNQKVASLNSQLQNSTKLINSQQTALSQLQNSLVPTQDQLLALTKEKEVINTEVDNLLTREINDYNIYSEFIGDTEEEVIMALKLVDSLLEPDPRKSRAFEYEVFAKIFDVTENQMKAGIQSILSGDYEGEKVAIADVFSKLVNSNITRLGKDEFDQETKNAFKNNPALIDQIAEESIRSYKTQDTAIYKIIDAAEKGIASSDKDRFANEIRDILRTDPGMVKEGRIDNVYYDLLFNGPTENTAAYAQVKLSADSNIERAYYTASWNFSDSSKMQVAAEVVTKIFGTYEDERKYYKISFDSNMNPEEAKKQKFTEEERLQYFDKYGEFFGSTSEKFVSVNNKISEFELQNASSIQELNVLSKEIEDAQTAEKQLQSQISNLNEQINQNQLNINTKQASLNSLQEQLAPLSGKLNSLKSEKTDLSAKLDSQIEAIEKEMEEKGRITLEAVALKEKYEADLSQLTTKISSIETQSKSATESINLLNSELSKIQTNEVQLKSQISSLNDQISINQTNIDNKKTSLNGLEQQLAKNTTELQALNSNKSEISIKFNEQIVKEQELTGKVSSESLALKKEYEAQLSILNQKISNVEMESTSINSSMNKITLELDKLKEIQTVTAQKALAVVPEDSKFTFNTTLNSNTAKIGVLSLGKSESEWANLWKGSVGETKIIDGEEIKMSAEEIQSVKAELAMNSAVEALSTGNISKELTLDANELNLASVVSSGVLKETLEQQTEYLTQAVRRGQHVVTEKSAMEGVKSLGLSQAEWAESWTGSEPTGGLVNNEFVPYTDVEKEEMKAKWAMIDAAQTIKLSQGLETGIVSGESKSVSELLSERNINIDQETIAQASTAATQAAIADVQAQAANIANQVLASAEAIATLDTSSVAEDVGKSVQDIIASSNMLSAMAAEGKFSDLASVEDIIGVSVESLTQDTSSWTEAAWAEAWTGSEPTGIMRADGKTGTTTFIEFSDAEKNSLKAKWAKEQSGAVKDGGYGDGGTN